MVRVAAAQTGLRGPIVASEQTDEFTRYAGASGCSRGRTSRQIYEGAAYRTPIHRVLALTTPRGQRARLRGAGAAAYASST